MAEPKIELVFQNESGTGYYDPYVAVYVNGVQYDKVWAYIDKEKGADGGWYNVVKFRRSAPESQHVADTQKPSTLMGRVGGIPIMKLNDGKRR